MRTNDGLKHLAQINLPRPVFFWTELRRDSKGLSTLEYAVLFITILIAAVVVWSTVGDTVSSTSRQGQSEFNRILDGEGTGSDKSDEEPAETPKEPKKKVAAGTKKERSNQYYTPK